MQRGSLLLWCAIQAGTAWGFPTPRDYLPEPDNDWPSYGGWNADGVFGLLYIIVACLAVAFVPRRFWYVKALAIGWPAIYLAVAVARAALHS